jgi:hypothetical protein
MTDKMMTKEREKFTASTEKLFGDSFKYKDFSNNLELESLGTPSFDPYKDGKGGQPLAIRDDDEEADPDTYDQYVGAKVKLPMGDNMMNAKVRVWKRQPDGTLLEKPHCNPILDTRMYEVEFMDGQKTELAANVIAQIMFAQCDSKGNQYLPLAGIVDHRKDQSAVEKEDMYIRHGPNLQPWKTTKGWSLCVKWKDGSTFWQALRI